MLLTMRAKEANVVVINRMRRRKKNKKCIKKKQLTLKPLGWWRSERGHLLIRRIILYILRGSLSNDERLFLRRVALKRHHSPFSPSKTIIIIIIKNNGNNHNNVLLLERLMRVRLNGWKRFVRIPFNNIWLKKNEHRRAYILHYNILYTYTQMDKLNFTRLVYYYMYIMS